MEDNSGRKRNWEAYSVIVAMIVFIGTTIIDFSKSYFADLQSKDNIRIMLAYEINKNHQIMHFLASTKNIGFDKNKEHLEGAPFPTDLNALGGIRFSFLERLDNGIYKSFFTQVNNLDKDEVLMIMEYYDLLNRIQTQLNLAKIKFKESKKRSDLEMDSYILNDYFQEEYRLSEKILKKYSYLLPEKRANDN